MTDERITLEYWLKQGQWDPEVAKEAAPEMYNFDFEEEMEDEKSNTDS